MYKLKFTTEIIYSEQTRINVDCLFDALLKNVIVFIYKYNMSFVWNVNNICWFKASNNILFIWFILNCFNISLILNFFT